MTLEIWNPNRWTQRWSGNYSTQTITESIPPFTPNILFIHPTLTLEVETPDNSFVLGTVTQIAEIGITPENRGAILPFYRLYNGISLLTVNGEVSSYELKFTLYERVKTINVKIWEYTP